MSVMTSFTLRSLRKNRVRTVVSVVGIALSCALLAAVFTSVASLQAGLYERTLETEGSWQVYAPSMSAAALGNLERSDNVADMAVSRELGSAYLTEQDSLAMGKIATVRTLPRTVKGTFSPEGSPLTMIPEISEGRMPENAEEIMLPDFCKNAVLGEGASDAGVSSSGPLEVGGTLSLDLGTRVVDDANGDGRLTLNSVTHSYLSSAEGTYPHDEEIVDASIRTYTVVGFYERQSSFLGNDFTAASSSTSIVAVTSADAGEEGDVTGAYLTVRGLSNAQAVQDLVLDAIGDEHVYPTYHYNLFRYQGIDDGRPITGTLWMIAYVLAAVIIVASVSLIYNSFAISVADRTRQFGLLSSIGASKKQLRRSVLFEAFFLGLIGIPLGVLVGLAGVALVFSFSQEAFAALLGTGGGVPVHIDPVVIAIVVLLSIVVLLASAWVPARRAGRVSAVDAIRQTQDVKLSKRAARKALGVGRRAARGGKAAVGPTGLAGKLFGAPGFIAHRSLSRSSARGRTVVASLAVSVALIVVSGSVAAYLSPIADRAEIQDGAGSGADITVSGSAPQMAEMSAFASDLDDFCERAEMIEGVKFLSSYRQGQADAVIPAEMISSDGRIVGDDLDAQRGSPWSPASFSEEGDYLGDVTIFYLDDASWLELVRELGLDEGRFTDASNPRAIALNRYQGILQDDSYADMKPFADTGTVDFYVIDHTVQVDSESWAFVGLLKDSAGALSAGYINQYSEGEPDMMEKPIEDVAARSTLEIGALADEVPASINTAAASMHFPAIMLPASVAGSAAGAKSPGGEAGLFDFYWSNLSFTAEDHSAAAVALEELAGDSDLLDFRVYDVAEASQQSRLIAQAVQLFIFCFSIIMLLIAVANVFNTLTNSIILRTREFAMLKSAGMGDRAFARMLAYECASYAVRGLVIGLIAATATTFFLYQAARLSCSGLEFGLPWPYVGAAVAVVLAVLAVSVAFALHKSHASSVVDALRADAV